MLKNRTSGILLHITSLPSEFGIGDFGPGAKKFADFLENAGMHIWQILPLTITKAEQGFSPYNSFSAFAMNPLLISPQALVEDRLLKKQEISDPPTFSVEQVDYAKCTRYKSGLFKKAFKRFQKIIDRSDYERFVSHNKSWLDDFTLFMALKEQQGRKSWSQWPAALKNRNPKKLAETRKGLESSIEYHQFLQYILSKQYFSLKQYCNHKGIQIFGDLPIYVTYDSADVWAGPQWFKLTRSLKPKFSAGVPPDYFSKTGQLWGNPVYDWKRQAEDGYTWWMQRLRHNFKLFDLLRIDHFRAFEAYWQVPAHHKTAMKGKWIKGPDVEFFRTLLNYHPQPPIVAEDLGEITSAVRELIARFSFPTMKVIQFAFDGDFKTNIHLPHNHIKNAVAYTGTHDNDTTRGWYRNELSASKKKILADYVGRKISQKSIHRDMIQMVMQSVADMAMVPMQDILGLDGRSRMNDPAKVRNNWRWRMKTGQLKASLAKDLRKLVELYGRL